MDVASGDTATSTRKYPSLPPVTMVTWYCSLARYKVSFPGKLNIHTLSLPLCLAVLLITALRPNVRPAKEAGRMGLHSLVTNTVANPGRELPPEVPFGVCRGRSPQGKQAGMSREQGTLLGTQVFRTRFRKLGN